MRSFEVLCAALFTLDVTGSGLAVALVTAARTLPMLLLGAFAGVMSEAVNRKRILLAGQIMSAVVSLTIAALAASGVAQPWHVGLAALLTGTVWSTEMSTRRQHTRRWVLPVPIRYRPASIWSRSCWLRD